jgi:hypothetical protein
MDRRNPYQRDNVHGVIPSFPNSSNSDAAQASHLMSLAMITEGPRVHTRRFSHLFKAATIRWTARSLPPSHRLPARHSHLIPMERGKAGNVRNLS